jgi:pyridinium-3,5-biscarboxylic acid mononucleotide sulfurtransferase
LDLKYDCLKRILARYDGVLVAFSGGADSTFLLRAAVDEIGDYVLAATVAGGIHPPGEAEEAAALAGNLGVEHLVIEMNDLEKPAFSSNPPDRCYHCKKNMYGTLLDQALKRGIIVVADGANADDTLENRPGTRAGYEMGVVSPLREAGFTKDEIRAMSRKLGLPTADKPASPCLATRFPYGMRITREALKQVAAAEAIIREIGIPVVRVRHCGDLARIEVPGEYFHVIMREAAEVERELKAVGYVYVTLDLRGYRTGSMNETLDNEGTAVRQGSFKSS